MTARMRYEKWKSLGFPPDVLGYSMVDSVRHRVKHGLLPPSCLKGLNG